MRNEIERSVVAGDLHFPFEDKVAVKLFLKFVKDFQPDNIFLNGDVVDCWSISRFTKPLHIDVRIEDELALVAEFLTALRKSCPDAKIVYVFGNHEYRFAKYIADNARELKGLKNITLPQQILQFCKGDPDVKFVDSGLKESYVQYGKLLIGHFNRVNKHSAYTAKNLLEDKGISIIQNHTHRGGSSYKRDFDKGKVAFENFCLCDLDPEYVMKPNWQLGFSVIHRWKKSHMFHVTQIPIIKNMLIYGDKIYKET